MDPTGVRSVYRLFLRALSASVLHKSSATRLLRRLYRPVFREAGVAANQLQSRSLPQPDQARLRGQLKRWNARVEVTLQMLVSSAQSRGLPDLLTRNLSVLMFDFVRKDDAQLLRPVSHWNGQWTESQISSVNSSNTALLKQRARNREVQELGGNLVNQTLEMAEITSGLIMGRIVSNPGTYWRQKHTRQE
ncbi:hypothetical protein BKA62DRAFT_687595 [Auriculariales sp. MPI-PUGE-AT-0066]|nr:hypothetical protein BKA62DRAFT_687595 [Auriculariales sp. MPI-PUGE-AT-0066]